MLKYDKTIKVGDIVTGYHNGYWRVTAIEKRREPSAPLVTYTKVLGSDMKPCTKSSKQCDISYCKKINKKFLLDMQTEQNKVFNEGINTLLELIKENI